jgi:hypothetical protein
VEARATNLVLLNQCNGQAELDGTNGGGVATTSCTKNDKVKSVLSHVFFSL